VDAVVRGTVKVKPAAEKVKVLPETTKEVGRNDRLEAEEA
jgi:hypothetical protein